MKDFKHPLLPLLVILILCAVSSKAQSIDKINGKIDSCFIEWKDVHFINSDVIGDNTDRIFKFPFLNKKCRVLMEKEVGTFIWCRDCKNDEDKLGALQVWDGNNWLTLPNRAYSQ